MPFEHMMALDAYRFGLSTEASREFTLRIEVRSDGFNVSYYRNDTGRIEKFSWWRLSAEKARQRADELSREPRRTAVAGGVPRLEVRGAQRPHRGAAPGADQHRGSTAAARGAYEIDLAAAHRPPSRLECYTDSARAVSGTCPLGVFTSPSCPPNPPSWNPGRVRRRDGHYDLHEPQRGFWPFC